MITTITLNPCIDWTITLPSVTLGGLNMVERSRTDVSGKGVNVAIVLRELGMEAFCAGISFSGNGALLAERLDQLRIPHEFMLAPGNIRTNIKVLDAGINEMTELNSRGDPVEPPVIEAFLDKLEALTAESAVVTFSGRIPNGADEDIYRRCLERLKSPLAILDAEKTPLKLAIQAKPYLIKPNLYELEATFGEKPGSYQEIVRICRGIIGQGVQVVCVSMGGDGAIIADEREAFHAPAPSLTPKGFQGSGDSMVAGICKAVSEKGGIDDMLRFGIAAASASIIREGTQLARREDYERFLREIRLERIK